MKLNFEHVISAGMDYCAASWNCNRNFPGPHNFCYLNKDNRNAYEAYLALEKYTKVLECVCSTLGITFETVIRTVRAENKYYERGGQRLLDEERLIQGLE